MVFGVFDGLHPGHQYFLSQAGEYGNLIVVVARDANAQQLKHKTPTYNQEKRIAAIREFLPDATVILGDKRQGTYEVVKTYRPAMILLGHDQEKLYEDLQANIDSGNVNFIEFKTLRELP